MNWQFNSVLDRAPTDANIDAIFESGLDLDVVRGAGGRSSYLMCDIEAETLTAAVIQVIQTVFKVAGIHIVGLDSGDAVTLGEAANRLGGIRTQASLRQLSTGERGPGGFPVPLATSGGRITLYSYAEIVSYLRDGLGEDIEPVSQELAILDLALRLAARARVGKQQNQVMAVLRAAELTAA